MITVEEIRAYRNTYRALRKRCMLIVPSCREGNVNFNWLAESKAYLVCLIAMRTAQQKRIRIGP